MTTPLLATIVCAACLLGGALMAAEPVAPRTRPEEVGTPAPYQARGGAIDIDISEYAGYGGLIVANGGMEPTAESFFARKGGFQVRLRMSESENWSALNEGRIAATVTTADVLPLLGPGMDAVVPLLISYSRGADGLVVRNEIKTVNDLAGKVVAVRQFIETEFLMRYLAQEAGLPVAVLPKPDAPPQAGAVNLLFAADGLAAGDLFAADLAGGRNRLAGCLTWAPKTTEVVSGSSGQARQLMTNRNLLVVADVLLINRGFAKQSPQVVASLVHGILDGNRRLRAEPQKHLPAVAKAFGWNDSQAKAELGKVHLANRAENLAFFNGTMDAAGSFSFIAQAAALVYSDYVKDPGDPVRLLDLAPLGALDKEFPDDKVDIRPQAGEAASVEPEPVLRRDVRFQFEANAAKLDQGDAGNRENLDRIAGWMRAGPGSRVVLVGHVEPTQREELEKKLGRMQAAIAARRLGQARAEEVRRVLIETRSLDANRLAAATRGWEQPLPAVPDPALNRRVEVQWKIQE